MRTPTTINSDEDAAIVVWQDPTGAWQAVRQKRHRKSQMEFLLVHKTRQVVVNYAGHIAGLTGEYLSIDEGDE